MAWEPSPLEIEIRRRFEAGDLDGALTKAIEGYGAEVYGFLIGLARDGDQASDVFSATCERLWKYLPGYRWEGPIQVWFYRIARNEFLRSVKRPAPPLPLSQVPAAVSKAIAHVRSTTPVYMRTEIKAAFAKIRERLDPDDHMLLGLRLDRKMAWNQIAEIMGAEAPALRKRFERLKAKLRELVAELREDG
jgi:RNA polymerase sigma factor (sigma-70 family)